MKIAEIKRLATIYPPGALDAALANFDLCGALPDFVEGADDGERYTHLFGARWVQNHMLSEQVDERAALRAYGALMRF